jgi:hypothetical protein
VAAQATDGNADIGDVTIHDPLAADDLVDAKIVFERVDARDVIIVGILLPPYRPASLIHLARDRFQRQLDLHVRQLRLGSDIRERWPKPGRPV